MWRDLWTIFPGYWGCPIMHDGRRGFPRTVRKYMPKRPAGRPRGDQRWSTFVHTHAKAIVACDFLVSVTATFRLLYVFVMIEHGSRRLLHVNVTPHPTAAWTLQQLREILGSHRHRRTGSSLSENLRSNARRQ